MHELGHTFGLIHCLQPRCVMNASTYVENIDQKPAEFCSSCLKGMNKGKGSPFNNKASPFSWWGKKQ